MRFLSQNLAKILGVDFPNVLYVETAIFWTLGQIFESPQILLIFQDPPKKSDRLNQAHLNLAVAGRNLSAGTCRSTQDLGAPGSICRTFLAGPEK